VHVSGPFDGLAHEPRRHDVQLVRVVSPGRSGGPETTVALLQVNPSRKKFLYILKAGLQAGRPSLLPSHCLRCSATTISELRPEPVGSLSCQSGGVNGPKKYWPRSMFSVPSSNRRPDTQHTRHSTCHRMGYRHCRANVDLCSVNCYCQY
jgi:hypothetical protein